MYGSDRCSSSISPTGTQKAPRAGSSSTRSPAVGTPRPSHPGDSLLHRQIPNPARPAVLLDQYRIGPALNFTYLVADAEGGEGVVIDPSYGIDPVLRAIDEKSVKVRYILNTHSHKDHVAGNKEVRERTGAKVVAHRVAPLQQDVSVDDGDAIAAGRLKFSVVHTPGHTKDSVLYIFEGNVATGDTLFVGECGRTDLPGGDPPRCTTVS